MKRQKIHHKAFTLIEVIVSITIFSMMSVSIIWIYIIISDITMKSDINRMMQENIKNVSNKIAEDIRKNGIQGVSSGISDDCNFNMDSNNYKVGDKLCTKSGNKYYLAKKNLGTGDYIRTTASNCSQINEHCVIVKGINDPLTNSYVSVKELNFFLSKDYIPKVTMNIVIQPSSNKGVKLDIIKESKIILQTTISERPF